MDSYIAGLILFAAAPCTAMVFALSRLSGGDPLFTLSQAALNELIMVAAFAPLVVFLLGFSAIVVPWTTMLAPVVVYIVVPRLLAQALRKILLGGGRPPEMPPWKNRAMVDRGAAGQLVLVFAFQGEAILRQPLVIALLAVPILVQVFFSSALAYGLNRRVGEKHSIACPSALIGAPKLFELAVAIRLFGFE